MKNLSNSPSRMGGVLLASMVLGALASPGVMAQGVYRIVGPDGRVSYSDQPPPPSANAKPVAGVASGASGNATLPTELRQAVARYPVTLYTGSDCAPCTSGRSWLDSRGIPYTEKTVNTTDDAAALKRLSGATTLPLLTIGGQQVKGYSATEWGQYLDAAGYPKQSALPASYRRPAASALVEAKAANTAPTPKESAANGKRPAPPPAETPIEPPVTNPSGIRF